MRGMPRMAERTAMDGRAGPPGADGLRHGRPLESDRVGARHAAHWPNARARQA
jgi:hypothetical protein